MALGMEGWQGLSKPGGCSLGRHENSWRRIWVGHVPRSVFQMTDAFAAFPPSVFWISPSLAGGHLGRGLALGEAAARALHTALPLPFL